MGGSDTVAEPEEERRVGDGENENRHKPWAPHSAAAIPPSVASTPPTGPTAPGWRQPRHHSTWRRGKAGDSTNTSPKASTAKRESARAIQTPAGNEIEAGQWPHDDQPPAPHNDGVDRQGPRERHTGQRPGGMAENKGEINGSRPGNPPRLAGDQRPCATTNLRQRPPRKRMPVLARWHCLPGKQWHTFLRITGRRLAGAGRAAAASPSPPPGVHRSRSSKPRHAAAVAAL